jgi:hypothetical protein
MSPDVHSGARWANAWAVSVFRACRIGRMKKGRFTGPLVWNFRTLIKAAGPASCGMARSDVRRADRIGALSVSICHSLAATLARPA